jgi:two-component system, response regulator
MRNKNSVEILLVEDDEDDARRIYLALKSRKLLNNLVHLKDGTEAVDFIFGQGKFSKRQVKNVPNVILLDLGMPGASSLDLVRKIKSDERTCSIPVVILTSSEEAPELQDCYRLGISSYITKPVVFEDFLNAIAELGRFWFVLHQPQSLTEQIK